jgi:obg-like ATPase 1
MKLSALFISTMERVEQMLNENKPIRFGQWSSPEVELIKEKLGNLITSKPVIYLVNLTSQDFIRKKNKWYIHLFFFFHLFVLLHHLIENVLIAGC